MIHAFDSGMNLSGITLKFHPLVLAWVCLFTTQTTILVDLKSQRTGIVCDMHAYIVAFVRLSILSLFEG